jgi:predicted secreted Zn-dependent protease
VAGRRWQLGDSGWHRFDLHSQQSLIWATFFSLLTDVMSCLRIFVILIFATTCCTIGLAQSVHRCLEKGKITFSQFPCPQVASAHALEIKPVDIADSRLKSNLVWKTYDVKGDSYASLLISLNANGPRVNNRSFHGLTNWNVSYTYQTKLVGDEPKLAGNLCRFSELNLMIDGDILMPRWIDEPMATADLRARWIRYITALKIHEEGHIQHGHELAKLLRERLLGFGNMACTQAGDIAQNEFTRLNANVRDRDREYDRRTQHGATQGALFQ